jgi:hypothetical protein
LTCVIALYKALATKATIRCMYRVDYMIATLVMFGYKIEVYFYDKSMRVFVGIILRHNYGIRFPVDDCGAGLVTWDTCRYTPRWMIKGKFHAPRGIFV